MNSASASSSGPLPVSIVEGLANLQNYCRDYLSDQVDPKTLPLEFWEIENDDIYFQVLGFLPLFIPRVHYSDVALPEGFRIAWPIFILEDDYYFNGWTAFGNWRDVLPEAAQAYARAGLPEEAPALLAAAAAVDQGLEDDQVGQAYLAAGSPYHDDEVRMVALERFFCSNRGLFLASSQ